MNAYFPRPLTRLTALGQFAVKLFLGVLPKLKHTFLFLPFALK